MVHVCLSLLLHPLMLTQAVIEGVPNVEKQAALGEHVDLVDQAITMLSLEINQVVPTRVICQGSYVSV